MNPYTQCCTLVNDKKKDLYNKTINRSIHKEALKRALGDKYDEVFFSNFEWGEMTECCNVIAFTLYFKQPITSEISNKFLLSIERSIKNISILLPDWVIRLYIGF
jgi:hypothetical protein